MLKKLYEYRYFIWTSVVREFQSRYKKSILGMLWAVFNPLAIILVYTVIFSQVMRAKVSGIGTNYSYGIYLCSGVFAWNFFSEMLMRLTTVFQDNANLLKKVNFPRLCLPVIATCTSMINFLIVFTLFLTFMLFQPITRFSTWPYFLLLFFLQVLFTFSLGIILGVLNVFFQDVAQFMTISLQFWFWLTPIVYPKEIVPNFMHKVFSLNPLYYIISGYQDIFDYGIHHRNWIGFGIFFILSILLAVIGLLLYRILITEMVDEL